MQEIDSILPANARRRLDEFLSDPRRPPGTLGLHELEGFLFAVACAPEPIMPSEWLPVVFGGSELEDSGLDDRSVAGILPTILTLYNEISVGAAERAPALPAGCEPLTPPEANFEPDAPLSQWSRGFQLGDDWLAEVWAEYLPPELEQEIAAAVALLTLFISRDHAESLRAADADDPKPLEQIAALVVEHFEQTMVEYALIGRTLGEVYTEAAADYPPQQPVHSEKIGRNEPCPCGSGKKYKKCCGGPGS